MIDLKGLRNLNEFSFEEMTNWVAQYLKTGLSSPVRLRDIDRSPCEMLVTFVRDLLPATHYVLGRRIKESIATLLDEVSPQDVQNHDFLWDLITAASRLKIDSAKENLALLLNGGRFKKIYARDEDLHYCIIDALGVLGPTDATIYALAKRDIEEIDYVDAVFRALYNNNLKSWVTYFLDVVRTIYSGKSKEVEYSPSDRLFLMASTVGDLLRSTGEESFTTDFVSIILPRLELYRDIHEKFEHINFIFGAIAEAYRNEVNEFLRKMGTALKERGYQILPIASRTDGLDVVQIQNHEVSFNIVNPALGAIYQATDYDYAYVYSKDLTMLDNIMHDLSSMNLLLDVSLIKVKNN